MDGSTKKWTLLLVVVSIVVLVVMAIPAFAAKAVVGKVGLNTGRPVVAENANSVLSAAISTKGYDEVGWLDTEVTRDQAQAVAQQNGADAVYSLGVVHTKSEQVFKAKYLLDLHRVHQATCEIVGWKYDAKTGQFSDIAIKTVVDPGTKMNPEISATLMAAGAAVAAEHAFKYAGPVVRGAGYVGATVGYLASTQATPAEAACVVTGELIWARNILPHAFNNFWRYTIGGGLVLVPLVKAHGDPNMLELKSLVAGASLLS